MCGGLWKAYLIEVLKIKLIRGLTDKRDSQIGIIIAITNLHCSSPINYQQDSLHQIHCLLTSQ